MKVATQLPLIAAVAMSADAEGIVIDSPMSPPDWALTQKALLAHGASARPILRMQRYANWPTLGLPWERQ